MSRRAASVAIVSTLVLQFVAGFKLLAPPKSMPELAPLRVAPAPALYPFLDYNMYIAAHSPGEALEERRLYGEFADGSRVRLRARELGVDVVEFRDRLFPQVRARKPEAIARVAALHRDATGQEVVALSWDLRRWLVGPPAPRLAEPPEDRNRVEIEQR